MKKIIVSIIVIGLLLGTVPLSIGKTKEDISGKAQDNVKDLSRTFSDESIALHCDREGDNSIYILDKISESNDEFISDTSETLFIYVNAGKDIITYVDHPTLFEGYALCPMINEIEYAWDFDGDGIFDSSSLGYSAQPIQASYIYNKPGTYTVTLKATDPYDASLASYGYVRVSVKIGSGNQKYIEESIKEGERSKPSAEPLPLDGIIEKYAVMINGGSESRFWIDVNFTYHMLLEDYGYTPGHVYLLNYNGANPDGENPDGMIDYSATKSNIKQVFNTLAGIIDGDDLLFVWVDDHGMGYFGPKARHYGFLYGYDAPFVDPGDEQDYLESEFKLRSFCNYGDYYSNMGMDEWKVHKRWTSSYGCYEYYRKKFVSSFSNIYFEEINSTATDTDVYIEKFIDYLQGDFDQDGYVETDEGEIYDYDGDGIPPYDPDTGDFDEDDWGEIYRYYDVIGINTGVPQSPSECYKIFDDGFDNHVDIDLHYRGGELEVDGTDFDNNGLFDGLDVNDDGDMNDWVSIDEQIYLYGDNIRDDELAEYMGTINAGRIIIFMEPCFSGGFIWDLSAPKRVICTATEGELPSWGNSFVRGFTSALHWADVDGDPVDADYDGDGNISIVEAFNYATENDHSYPEGDVSQYDDNGDGMSHSYPIPNGSDGGVGCRTFLWGFQNSLNPPNKPDTPSGPTSGEPGIEYEYTTCTTDPDGDYVKYGWDWQGDFIVDEWTDFYPSGTPVTVSHSWSLPGPRWIRVKARDVFGAESGWSDPLSVTMPLNQPSSQSHPHPQSNPSPSQQSTPSSTTISSSQILQAVKTTSR